MRQKGFSHLILLLVIGVILVGGYFALSKGYIQINQNPNKQTDSMSYASSTPLVENTIVEPTQSTDLTKDWIEFKTDFYSFKYPQTWGEVPPTEGCGPVFVPKDNSINGWVTICGTYINDDDTIENLSQRESNGSKLISTTNLIIDGHKSIRLELQDTSTSIPHFTVLVGDVKSTIHWGDGRDEVKPGTLSIYFYFQSDKNLDEAREIFTKMVNTISFQYK